VPHLLSLMSNFENLGVAYHKTGSKERALETFKLGLALRQQLNTGPLVGPSRAQ
jgi:hypothetical protein